MAERLEAIFELKDMSGNTVGTVIRNINKIGEETGKTEQKTGKYSKTAAQAYKEVSKNASDAANAVRKVSDAQENAGKASGSGLDGVAGKLTRIVSQAYLARKGFELMSTAVNGAALQKVQETTLQAILKNEQAGSDLYKYISAYAKQSALGREDLVQGVTSALSVTRDINQVEQFMKMVERLQAKDPTKGAQQAVFSLKELLAGDVVSARGVYGITGISGEKIRSMMDSGDTQGALDYISAKLDQFGATQEVVDKNFNGLNTQIGVFTSNLQTAISETAQPVMETLAGTVRQLNEDMDAGKFQPFINVMVGGMQLIGNGIAWVAQNANWLIPIVGGLVVGLLSYKAAQSAAAFWTMITKVATSLLIGDWVTAIGVVAGVTTAVWGLSEAFKSVDASMSSPDLTTLKKEAGLGLSTTSKMPVQAELVNKDPVSVKGTVDIEEESLKYALDIAGARFFAKFSTATMAPQFSVSGVTIHQTADVDEILDRAGDKLSEMTQAAPEGVYNV